MTHLTKVMCGQRFYRDKRSCISKIGNWKSCHSTCQNNTYFSGVSKERGYGEMTKKGRASVGKNGECMRVKSISYF